MFAVTIDWLAVGDTGNAPDDTGYGTVNHEYRIAKYEATIGQYAEFLNAAAKSDPYGLWHPNMATDLTVAGISRTGSSGNYEYALIGPSGATRSGASSAGNRPITYVSWFDAARFANWLQNGQGTGSTETGAYTLVGGQTSGVAPEKNAGAQFYIPTENEWYKAAFYKGGGANAGYWEYATQSDASTGNTIGGSANQSNVFDGDYAVTQSSTYSASQNYLTEVGAFFNSGSAYGTFDQSGNVREWNELNGEANSFRGTRGEFFGTPGGNAQSRLSINSNSEGHDLGFRLASVPNRAPTDAELSAVTVPENRPAGAVVGNFSTIDPDVGDTFSYQLVNGAGDADNASFTIVGTELRANASFNFEARSSYTVRIRSTDQGGLWREESFTITVTNVAEPLSIAAVIPPAAGTYRVGAVLRFTLIASEPVTVVGRPTVNLRIGTATRVATFESAVGNQLVFAYRVVAGDHDLDGVVLGAVINKLPRGVSIRDTQGRNMPLGLPPVNSSSVRIDNKGPLSVGLVAVPRTGIYRAGETLEFRVSFNELVQVSGVPQIQFSFMTGSRRQVRQAQYVEGSGSTLLIFRYTVQLGDIAPKGITLATAINMGLGGSIRDLTGNTASLKLRVPSAAGIRLDATAIATVSTASRVGVTAREAAFGRYLG